MIPGLLTSPHQLATSRDQLIDHGRYFGLGVDTSVAVCSAPIAGGAVIAQPSAGQFQLRDQLSAGQAQLRDQAQRRSSSAPVSSALVSAQLWVDSSLFRLSSGETQRQLAPAVGRLTADIPALR